MVPDTERKWIAREQQETPMDSGGIPLVLVVLAVVLWILWKACS
jgi:hypothetical protein